VPIQDFEIRFFEHLKAEFEADYSEADKPQAVSAKMLIERYQHSPESITASDIYELELLILGLQPRELLIQRAVGLRRKYHELAGDEAFSQYRPAPFPSRLDDSAGYRLLLADLQNVLHFLHWSYLLSPIREKLRTGIIKTALMIMAISTVVWTICTFLCYRFGQPFLAVLLTVMYAGLIGGFISSQRRMQMIPTTGDPLASISDLTHGRYFLWFAPVTGAIFAPVLMLFFIAKILTGVIFPEFRALSSGGGPQSAGWPFTYQLLPAVSVPIGDGGNPSPSGEASLV
jgi:hypothetical protein